MPHVDLAARFADGHAPTVRLDPHRDPEVRWAARDSAGTVTWHATKADATSAAGADGSVAKAERT